MTEAEKLIKIAQNEQLITNANAELEEALYSISEGGKSWYDRFWDNYQNIGKLRHYNGSFMGNGWTIDTFLPKYDMKPTGGYMMFRESKVEGDLTEILTKLGITLDFSDITAMQYTFQQTTFTKIGVINAPKVTQYLDTFNNSNNLETIEKIVVTKSQTFSRNVFGCRSLKHIVFEGEIGGTIYFDLCPFTKASFENIIGHLSLTTTGQTVTFNKAAKEEAFTNDEWNTLIAPYDNWTISLV